MEITTQQLLAIMPNAEKNIRSNRNWLKDGRPMTANEATALLNRYAKECGITTPLHWVHFLANVAVESGCLRNSEENLNYSAKGLRTMWPARFITMEQAMQYAHKPEKIANYVYAMRMGNGSRDSGDGWRYRGRGLIGYTGKANYQEYAKWCGYDVVKQPDLLAGRTGAFRSAAHFFAKNCLTMASRDNGQGIRRRINGGLTGWTDCQQYIDRAKQVLL